MRHDTTTRERAVGDDRLASAKPKWLELAYVDERESAKTAWVVVTLSCNGQPVAGMSPVIKKRRRRHGGSAVPRSRR
jgi:hypothetical protein